MGLFKKKIVKEIHGAAWGHLVHDHNIDVDTLTNEYRAVEREGRIEGVGHVTFLRVFKRREAEKKGVQVTGWEVFDEHPDLLAFEGYMTTYNKAVLEKKRQ